VGSIPSNSENPELELNIWDEGNRPDKSFCDFPQIRQEIAVVNKPQQENIKIFYERG
jgi:hypothetical protein